MNVNKLLYAIAATALTSFCAGCGEPLIAGGVRLEQGGEGGGGGALPLPGSNGKYTTESPGVAAYDKMKIIRIGAAESADPETVTSPATFITWPDNKYHVQGFVAGSSSLDSAGFNDNVLVYYDEPFSGNFTISARVKMTAASSASTAKGLHLGAFAPQRIDGTAFEDSFRLTRTTMTIGALFRTANSSGELPAIRFYYSTTSASDGAVAFHAGTTGQTLLTNLDWKKEFIYELSRNGNQYRIRILNSKTYTEERVTLLPESADISTRPINERLLSGQPVYAGICLMGSSAEISQIRVWKKYPVLWNYLNEGAPGYDVPDFMMPATEPAYVPAANINMTTMPNFAQNNAVADTNGKPMRDLFISYSAISANSNGIDLTPELEPAWANSTIGFQWFTIVPHEGMTLAGAGTELLSGSGIWPRGRISVDPAQIPSGSNEAVFLAVARDPTLDTPETIAAPDYSLLQTLPEYYFQIRFNR